MKLMLMRLRDYFLTLYNSLQWILLILIYQPEIAIIRMI